MKKYISLLLGSQICIINSVRPELQCQECQLHDSMYISIQIHSEPLVLSCFSYLGVHNCHHVIINYERTRTTHRRIKTRLTVNQWVFPFQFGWHQIERFLSYCLVTGAKFVYVLQVEVLLWLRHSLSTSEL